MSTKSSAQPLWILAILVTLTPAAHSAETVEDFRWVDKAGESLELRHGEQPVVRYMYTAIDQSSPEAREKTYKPYLHVFSPDGQTLLTKGPGGLYPHHRGIFFGFNKVTYGDGLKCDTWHCTGKAHQRHVRFESKNADADSGSLVSVIHWHGAKGEHFATEHRAFGITGAIDGIRIDFASRLEPVGVKEIRLDGDPQHAGVQFRAAQHVAEKTKDKTYFLRPDGKGKPGETRNWNHKRADDPMNEETTNRPWLAMSFVIDDQRYTALYIDHPENPKPSHYSERDYGRFGSFFVTDVTKGNPLQVRYRYVIRKGEMTVEECETLRKEFINE